MKTLKAEGIVVNLESHEKDLVRSAGAKIRYPKGQIVFAVGEYADRAYFIENGWVKIYRIAEDGRRVTVAIRRQGEFFGLAEALCGGERICYAEAMDDIDLIVIRKDNFFTLLRENADLAIKIAMILGARLREAQATIHEIVSWPVPGRLVLLLLKLAERSGVDTGNGIELNLRLTHEEIACMIGTSRPTVSLIFNSLKNEKAIVMKGRDIKKIYPEKLKKWVK
ncbi:MAG: Crp/Fnr family transcriptional regulator [Bacillota bacterium]